MTRRRLIITASLACLVALLAVFALWPSLREKQAVAALRSAGATVTFDYQSKHDNPPNPIADWLRSRLGDEFFGDAENVTFGATSPATDANLVPLSALPHLRHLMLDGKGVTDRTATLLSHIVTLESVNLMNTSLTGTGLQEMASCGRLESLTVYGAAVTDETLKGIEDWPSLKYLQVVRAKISAEGVESISAVRTLKGLHLWQAGDLDDTCLVDLERLPKLESLHVAGTPITDAGLRSCAAWKSLRYLRIYGPQVTDEGLKHLQGLDSLEVADFQGSAVQDPVTLSELPKLKEVDLSSSRIIDAGIESLSKSRSIASLRLLWTDLTDVSMQHLASLRTLQSLEIGPHVTESAARTLHATLPNCRIELVNADGGHTLTLKAKKPPATVALE